MDSLRLVVCADPDCGQEFLLCRRCDRGNRYCSPGCSQRGRQRSLRKARRRHRLSPEDRLDHRDRNRAYRRHRSQRVMEHGSDAESKTCIVLAPAADASTEAEHNHGPTQASDFTVRASDAFDCSRPVGDNTVEGSAATEPVARTCVASPTRRAWQFCAAPCCARCGRQGTRIRYETLSRLANRHGGRKLPVPRHRWQPARAP